METMEMPVPVPPHRLGNDIQQLNIDFSNVDLDSIQLPPGEDFGIKSEDEEEDEDSLEFETGFGNIVVVDNLPVVPTEKFEKLEGVVRKIFGQIGTIRERGLWMPIHPETQKTQGYCFIEYNTSQEAQTAKDQTNGYKLDKSHVFAVSMFDDFDRFMKVSNEWISPETKAYTPGENLQQWLTDEKGRDQFVIRANTDTEVYWNDPRHLKPDLVYRRGYWTESFVQWSSLGTYLATVHRQGAAIWGGSTTFNRLMRFAHPQVKLIDFSPGEKFLVTYSSHEPSNPRDTQRVTLNIFEVRTGKVLREFKGSADDFATGGTGGVAGVSWPVFRWVGGRDDKYFARIGKNAISVYETDTMSLLDKKSLKVDNVMDFCWSPTDPILALFVPEGGGGNQPAKVSLVQIPGREELRQKNLFSVSDCKMYWQSNGDRYQETLTYYSFTMSESIDTLRARYDAAGQGHLFTFWPQLSETEQAELTAQLETLDIARVNHIYKKAIAAEKSATAAEEAIEPLPQDASDAVTQHPERAAEWRATGLAAVARGEVGVLLMAGGQGTRLGSSAPKGCYDIGLPSHKSLFQYQAERIARLQQVAQEEAGKPEGSVVVPWYIMTSGPTRRETEEFFKTNAYFGLKPENVVFFEQGTLPCLTMDGKVLLETKSRIAVAPDGNGGVYAALRSPLSSTDKTRSVLSDLESRKVLYVHAYCVDNCLVRVADPVFVGYGISKQADCAAKVVPKAHPTEAVGVVARRGAKYSVVEYSEISAAQAAARDGTTGELLFRAGNIANHFYSTAFLRRVAAFEDDLAFHIARKKIPHVALPTGVPVKPSAPNGMKLEMFVFDVFPHTERFAVLEVAREEEFSPLKNAPGTGADDPETSRRDLLAQHRRFLEAAGAAVKDGVEIELSPLVTYAGEGLAPVKGKTFTRSGVVSSVEELEVLAA